MNERSEVHSPPIQKIDWCLGLMIRAIIKNGCVETLKKRKKVQGICNALKAPSIPNLPLNNHDIAIKRGKM